MSEASQQAAEIFQVQPVEGTAARPIQLTELERERYPPEVSTQMADDNSGKGALFCALLVMCSIGALLVVILVPMAFADLEYYEMGFVRRKSTGAVDRSKVYLSGRHWIGIDFNFKTFKANAHLETFNQIEVFNMERISVTMTCTLQYFLIPDELNLLHDAYDLTYAPILRKSAQSAIKNTATNFTVLEYRTERAKVSKALFDAVKKALGGTCCPKDCTKFDCYAGCKAYSSCTLKDKGLFASVKFFQLQKVDITAEQTKNYLQKVVEQEKQDTEQFTQQEKIERKKTEQEKVKIENQALEVSQNATAKSGLIAAQAAASAKAVVEDARNSGLQIIYSAINVTKEEHKKSLDYIRTLRNHKNSNMYIGFTTMIGRENK